MPEDHFPDYLDHSGRVAPASREQVREELKALEGSFRIRVQDRRQANNNPSKFVTLRVDCESGLVSGDLFHDAAGSRWILSWRSDAIYAVHDSLPGDQRFVALCATFFPKAEKPHPFAKLIMSARVVSTDGDVKVPEFRLAVVDGKDKLYDLDLVEKAQADHSASLRRFRLYVDVEPALEEAPFGQVIDRVIGRKGPDGELACTIRHERLGQVIRRRGRRQGSGLDIDDSIQRITAMLSERSDRDARDHESFIIVLSAAEDDGDDILGRTIGIDRLPQRFGSRRAAVVFPKEIRESFRRQRRRYPEGEADLAEFAYRLKFTILHEFGHLLNLPHCWHRDGFADVRLPAEPAEPTWMQYGSLFPLGSANEFALEQIESRDARRDKRDALAGANFAPPPAGAGPLLKAGFTSHEKRHLYHAPHDQISAGGRTFVDAERQVLRMQAPDEGASPLKLTIQGATSSDGVASVVLQNYVNLRAAANFQPPTGEVRFRQRDTNGDGEIDLNLPFRFSAGTLLWLFREEVETMWTNAGPRLELVYEPELTLLAPDMLHPRRNLGAEPGEDDRGRYVDFVAPLPLLLPDFLFRRFTASHFTTQVAYVPPGGTVLYSNQVRITYDRNEEIRPFGRATGAIGNLLSDEALPALGETALYYPHHPLDRLEGVAEMKQLLLSAEVQDAIEDLRGSGRLEWLERLVAFVETRRLVETIRAGLELEELPASWHRASPGSETAEFLERQVQECAPARELFRQVRSRQ